MSFISDSNKTYSDDQTVIADILDGGGVNANLSVSTTAIEVKVGTSRLPGRKLVIIQPKGNNVYLGFSNAVTSSNGIELFNNQNIVLPVGENTEVWLIRSSGTTDVRISEVA